ncbi:MAG: alanine--tRNA ligase [Deltaproteobacteria bacterium]|nr:alanine--tRNA ligase [Deltaproteobacteria bacterium]
MTGNEIRQKFLDYFNSHGHTVVASSSLLPKNDPTLLFTNAGMNQFKRVFLGEDKRSYSRAASSQKCVRAGGKHNDLENVGHTARHHTFFEMLGNFSFGDYFKSEAIAFAWDLLVKVYGLPPDKLYATVYQDDDEAHELWKKVVGIPESRIVRLGEKDNFWSMGDTGPCGPCSEILIDQGVEFSCGRPDCTVGCDCDRYLELWNLVFMQYNRDETGKLTPLPRPSIDTGMGLERITAVLQGKKNNFETDLFAPILTAIADISGSAYGRDDKQDIAFKVIADHARAITFLITDGIMPSNEGRGYVLRRILRRAFRYGRNLGVTQPFLHRLTGVVAEAFADVYPELAEAKSFVSQVTRSEEDRFSETLDYGLKLLAEEVASLKNSGGTSLPGPVVFKLYDTYGFPLDIINDIIIEDNLSIDQAGFEASMTQQREMARKSWKGSGDTETAEAFRELAAKGVCTKFIGYDEATARGELLAVVKDGQLVDQAGEGDEVELILDITPLYGQSGGQVGDTGTISDNGRLRVDVTDVLKLPGDLIVHKGRVTQGMVAPGLKVEVAIDADRRAAIAANHTATHILQAVLRQTLGDHVRQSGSLVTPDRLRFDFTHFAPISESELLTIENLANARIRENIPVQTHIMAVDEAVRTGAMALFEERYGDVVRMLELPEVSTALSGGTHLRRTGDLGTFILLSETGSAAGIRRIEAITGRGAVEYLRTQLHEIKTAAGLLKSPPTELASRVEKLLTRQKELETELDVFKARLRTAQSGDLVSQAVEIGPYKLVAAQVGLDSPEEMRDMADKLKDRLNSAVIVLAADNNGKVMLIVVVTKDLAGQKVFHAGDLIKQLAAKVGGKGGGRPDMAQAGGPDPTGIPAVLALAKELVTGKVK